MKRMLFCTAALAVAAALGWMPFHGTDVAKLEPVEVVYVTLDGREVVIETDTAASGRGADIEAAFTNMKETAAGEVFLETADHLILSRNAEKLLPELSGYLRPACSVCIGDGEIDLKQAAAYLSVHEPVLTMTDWRAGSGALPVLTYGEGEMRIVQ